MGKERLCFKRIIPWKYPVFKIIPIIEDVTKGITNTLKYGELIKLL